MPGFVHSVFVSADDSLSVRFPRTCACVSEFALMFLLCPTMFNAVCVLFMILCSFRNFSMFLLCDSTVFFCFLCLFYASVLDRAPLQVRAKDSDQGPKRFVIDRTRR